MNKRKKTSSQKQFMQTMIITGVIGLVIMVLTIIYMMKLFSSPKVEVLPGEINTQITEETKDQIDNMVASGMIHDIDSQDKNIKLWDIEENQLIKLNIIDKTKLQDQYGKPMSIKEIQKGDIIEAIYDRKSKNIEEIQKNPKEWIKSSAKGLHINSEAKTITIGNKRYEYTDGLLVVNEEQEVIKIDTINELDTLTFKGLGDQVWYIQATGTVGYLKLKNIPTKNGTIEIGNNTIYSLDEIEEHITLPIGEHKIVIRMEGYEAFAEHIDIVKEETHELDLAIAKEIVTSLDIRVTNTPTEYVVIMDGKTYKKGEIIQVKPGEYTLKVVAEGFATEEVKVKLEEGNQLLNISLTKEEINQEPNNQPNDNTDNTINNEIKTVQILLETDPAGAQVFVSGVYKGTTPALTGLKPGEYSLTIEKEGYSTLYSTIVIDASNTQKAFLYTLDKE